MASEIAPMSKLPMKMPAPAIVVCALHGRLPSGLPLARPLDLCWPRSLYGTGLRATPMKLGYTNQILSAKQAGSPVPGGPGDRGVNGYEKFPTDGHGIPHIWPAKVSAYGHGLKHTRRSR